MNSETEIIKRYVDMELDSESETYLHTHAMRFAYLLGMVRKVRKNFVSSPVRIMDIGPSFFTDILMTNLQDDHLYTLGFAHDASRGGHFPPVIKINKDHFFAFDLNDAQYTEKWIEPARMDMIVMAEVLEHLYTSPVHIFRFIASMMNPGGYLIIGTPNEQICVTVIATGFERKVMNEDDQEVAGVAVETKKTQPMTYPSPGVIDFEVETHENASTVIFDQKKEYQPSMDEIASAYNPSKEPFMEETPKVKRNIELSQHSFEPSRLDEKKMYSHKNIVELENIPAYKRRRVHLDDPVDSSQEEGPTWTYHQEDDEPEIKRNSPYLHDNVD